MYDLNTIRYINGSPKYKRMIDRRVKIIKIKEWIRDKIRWVRG
tara:strand:- start:137 stop:265 length:129 start_codon:yes stop_codon:yes gene_type:complete